MIFIAAKEPKYCEKKVLMSVPIKALETNPS